MMGPIISNTLLLFAIACGTPKMVLSPKLSQIYSFCFNKSLFDTQFSGFIHIDFTKFKRQMVNMNDFEQLVARKRYTYLGHCILG